MTWFCALKTAAAEDLTAAWKWSVAGCAGYGLIDDEIIYRSP